MTFAIYPLIDFFLVLSISYFYMFDCALWFVLQLGRIYKKNLIDLII